MRSAGRERVINALLAAPRVTVPTFLLIFPDIDRRNQEEAAFRVYLTDALKIIGRLNVRYIDIITPEAEAPESDPEKILRGLIERGTITPESD